MTCVEFEDSKSVCHIRFKHDIDEELKWNAVRTMLFEAHYEYCGYLTRPKCEYLEL